MWRAAACACALMALSCHATRAAADEQVRYQKRAQRFEGIRELPVSGYQLELRSARIEYLEPAQPVADRLALKFYLDQPADVHITVRELELKQYYWLDQVVPSAPWQPQVWNLFEWPTKDVVKRLPKLKVAELGAVVRLDKDGPSDAEHVAPAILYQRTPPQRAAAYVFSFHLRNDANVTSAIYREGEDEPLERKRFPNQSGGTILSVRWDASSPQLKGGPYRLVLQGVELDTNKPIRQVVRFYHQPLSP